MDANALKEISSPIKSVLITQSQPPAGTRSPYAELTEKYGLQVDFRPFIEIQGIDFKEFRKQKIKILDYTAIIFTSKHAIDNFFRIAKEAKLEMPSDMKYFCISEQTTNYLQKYIVMRKRKIFTGQKNASDLIEIIKKHKTEKFLYPCSAVRRDEIPLFMAANSYTFAEAVMYETVPADLSDMKELSYDIIVFFSPSGVASLKQNFPKFEQGSTRFAAFGSTTALAIREAGFRLDIEAPAPNAPSMVSAIMLYLDQIKSIKLVS